MTSPLVRTMEAAEFLHVSRATINSLIDSGELEAVNVGGAKVNGKKRQRAIKRITTESLNKFARSRSLHFGK